jgi:hypothetical protein
VCAAAGATSPQTPWRSWASSPPRIGLRAAWFQTCKRACAPTGCVHWHYDVTDSKRADAITAGAKEIDIREWGAICASRRAAQRAERGGEG